eukprot:gene15987-19018_t
MLDLEQQQLAISAPVTEFVDTEFPELKGRFKVLDKIGQGTFSGVYKSVCIDGAEMGMVVALKRVAPTSSPTRILNEITSLLRVGGQHFVSQLLGSMRYQDQVTLILPYFEHDSFKDYFFKMTPNEFRYYLSALFTALKHVHANNICHRDVKPTNFLYNQKKNTFMLIDFGLAQEMPPETDDRKKRPREDTNTRSRKTNQDANLAEIIAVIGTDKIKELATLLDKQITTSEFIEQTRWCDLARRLRNESGHTKEPMPEEAFDLLERCLDPNPFTRITASDALLHPFLLPLLQKTM